MTPVIQVKYVGEQVRDNPGQMSAGSRVTARGGEL